MSSLFIRKIFLTVLLMILVGVSTMNEIVSNRSKAAPQNNEETRFKRERRLPQLLQSNNDNFIIVAHRGAKAEFPENTMPAFKAAYEKGAEMIELDVRLSKDGVPVAIHDARLNRTTTGKGLVSQTTVEELKMLDAGTWFAKKFKGTRVPTLEEVLKFSRDKIALNIEVKTSATASHQHRSIEEKCLNLVKKYEMQDHVLFSSFDYRVIKNLRNLDKNISLALLYNWKSSGDLFPSQLTKQYGTDAFNCARSEINSRWIEDLRKNDIPLFVYTINRKRYMKQLLGNPAVKGIITNKPGLLNRVAESFFDTSN